MTNILLLPPQHRIMLVKNYAHRHWQKGGGWDLIVEGCVPDAEIILITKSANTERGVLVLMSRQLKSVTPEQREAMLTDKRTLLTVVPTKRIANGYCMSCRTRHKADSPHDEELAKDPATLAAIKAERDLVLEQHRVQLRERADVAPMKTPAEDSIKFRENELMRKIMGIYCQLSPENLHCDGEISASAAQRQANKLYKELDKLFEELGREVSEDEAYAWENANPVRPFAKTIEDAGGERYKVDGE